MHDMGSIQTEEYFTTNYLLNFDNITSVTNFWKPMNPANPLDSCHEKELFLIKIIFSMTYSIYVRDACGGCKWGNDDIPLKFVMLEMHVFEGMLSKYPKWRLLQSYGRLRAMLIWNPKILHYDNSFLGEHCYYQFSQWLLYHLTQFYWCHWHTWCFDELNLMTGYRPNDK